MKEIVQKLWELGILVLHLSIDRDKIIELKSFITLRMKFIARYLLEVRPISGVDKALVSNYKWRYEVLEDITLYPGIVC